MKRLFTEIAMLVSVCWCKPNWDIGVSEHGLFFMHYAETRRSDELRDDLVVWIGPAASGPRVLGKQGEVALPTAWGPYVDVLFVDLEGSLKAISSKGECSEVLVKRLWDFITARFSSYRTVYFAGVWANGGSCLPLLSAQKPLSALQTIGGTMIVDPPLSPTARFVAHSSLQSGNGELNYSANRAAQNVVCNANLSAVSFIMDDVHLRYRPQADSDVESEHRDYVLESVYVPGVGSFTSETFLKATSSKSEAEGNTKMGPFLPDQTIESNVAHSSLLGVLPHFSEDPMITLLKDPLGRVVLLRTLKHHYKLTCSYYIGIFVSEGLVFEGDVGDHLLNLNRASLEEVWPWGDSSPVGEAQEAAIVNGSSGQVVWAHANTAAPWSRRGSLRFLSLLKGDINEIDFFSVPRADSDHDD
jgi:hypothetical protein